MIKLKDILNEILQEMPSITKRGKNVMAGEQPLKGLNEWHKNAKLEAYTDGHEFLFFRNGLPAGIIQDINNKGYIMGFAVRRDLQGAGLGKAMLQYVFEKRPDLEKVSLMSYANAFYHKIGGQRKKRVNEVFMRGFTEPKRQGSRYFEIPREKMTPSPFHFSDIGEDMAYRMWKKQKFDSYPSINEIDDPK